MVGKPGARRFGRGGMSVMGIAPSAMNDGDQFFQSNGDAFTWNTSSADWIADPTASGN